MSETPHRDGKGNFVHVLRLLYCITIGISGRPHHEARCRRTAGNGAPIAHRAGVPRSLAICDKVTSNEWRIPLHAVVPASDTGGLFFVDEDVPAYDHTCVLYRPRGAAAMVEQALKTALEYEKGVPGTGDVAPVGRRNGIRG